jgi:hypothetical protein
MDGGGQWPWHVEILIDEESRILPERGGSAGRFLGLQAHSWYKATHTSF